MFQQHDTMKFRHNKNYCIEHLRQALIYCSDLIDCYFIVAAPDLIVIGYPVSADVGSLGVLTCSVSNNPSGTSVTYQWKRNGNLLATSETYQISSVNISDAGVYTCEANFSASGNSTLFNPGTSSVNVTLTVTSK